MNEEIKEKAMSALSTIIDDVGKIREFTIEQAPDVIQQLILFNRIEYSMYIAMNIVFGIILCIIAKKVIKSDLIEEGLFFTWLGLIICGAVSIGLFCDNVEPFLKVWIAPKIWLLEYGANLL